MNTPNGRDHPFGNGLSMLYANNVVVWALQYSGIKQDPFGDVPSGWLFLVNLSANKKVIDFAVLMTSFQQTLRQTS